MTLVSLPDGYSVNVEVSGNGPTLVLLHGFTGSGRSWGEFGVLLAERFTVVAVDLAGHGQNRSPSELHHYTMPQCVDDTVDALRLTGCESAHWVGYSMGGRTALHVAAAHPGAVLSLSLIGASPGLDCVEDRVARRSADELLATRIERDGVEAFVDYWQSIPLFATQRALPVEARARIREGRLGNCSTGLANSLRGMGTGAQEPLHDRLAFMTMPVLVMAGELDQKFTAVGRDMAGVLPHARFAPVAGAGHAAQAERPAECAELIVSFIASVESKREN